MRKKIIVCITCLFSACISNAETLRFYSSEQKQWGVAASGVLTWRNDHDLFSLTGCPALPETREEMQSFLVETWGIESREELLESMERVSKKGIRSKYERFKREQRQPIFRMFSWRDRLREKVDPAFRAKQQHRNRFVEEHAGEIGDKSLTGFDLMRVISLARWGTGAEYLTEDEAWEWIMPAAQKLQQTYSSWKDLGNSYVIGRQFWSHSETLRSGHYNNQAVYWLTHNEHSPWKTLDWDLGLTGSAEFVAETLSAPETELFYYGRRLAKLGKYDDAVEMLLRAKDAGSALSRGLACKKLGDFYQYGRSGIEVDIAKAKRFYEEGTAYNNEGCLLKLGLMYHHGRGCPKDNQAAYTFWMQSAEQGSVVGLENVGLLYARGQGVGKNLDLAMKYYNKATENGSTGSENGAAWLMYTNLDYWDADQAVQLAYAAIRKDECNAHYDTLVKVLIKAERFSEAYKQMSGWERLYMRDQNNYDRLSLPKRFVKIRKQIEANL